MYLMIIILVFSHGLLMAQVPAPAEVTLTVSAVMDSLRARFSRIEDYQVDLKVRLKMRRLRVPRKRMTLSFKQPDQLALKARGFAMVPRRGLLLSPDSLLAGLGELRLAGDTLVAGRPALVLQGESEIEGQYWRSEVLVDRQRWVILGAASYSDTLELLRLNTDFEEVTAGIFLPVRTTIHFNLDERFIQRLPQGPRRRKHRGGADHQPREGTGGAGEAVIEFSNYRVNQGLPDDLFVQAKEEEN